MGRTRSLGRSSGGSEWGDGEEEEEGHFETVLFVNGKPQYVGGEERWVGGMGVSGRGRGEVGGGNGGVGERERRGGWGEWGWRGEGEERWEM